MRETPSSPLLQKETNEDGDDDKKIPWYLGTFFTNFMAGGTAASVSVTVIAPFERIKLLLQVQKSAENIPPKDRYKGIKDCLVRIPKEQGFLSFWRGNTASVLRCFPYQALNFSVKDKLREIFHQRIDTSVFSNRILANLLAGGLAGSSALALIYPLDYSRTRLAVDIGKGGTRQFKNIRDTLWKTYKLEGRNGLYRGFTFSVFGVFLYRSVYFGIFDTGVEVLPSEYRHSFWVQFSIAEVSAITGGVVSYPLDTVRRSMMMQSGREDKLYNSSMDCYRKLYKKYGFFGFYHGGLANIVRGTGGALMLIVYDKCQVYVSRKTADSTETKDVKTAVDSPSEPKFHLPPSGLISTNDKKTKNTEGSFHFCIF